MYQEQRVLNYLKERGEITTRTAMLDLGISRLSNVIRDLKRHGKVIVSNYETANNRYGEAVTYKVYRLGSDDNDSYESNN